MQKRDRARGWLLLSLLAAGACGPELALPHDREAGAAVAGAADEGFTGEAGAPDAAGFAETLPVIDRPIYTPFGGAGGEGGAAPERRNTARGGGAAVGSASSVPNGGEGGAGGSGGAAFEPVEPARLLFSEYLEGSGSYKALEIYALAASSLEGCELRTYSNGKADAASHLALHGALGAGETQVLCSSSLATAQPAACDRSTNLNFNGDDALELACDDVTLDVFGQVGTDPGTAWGNGATVDHTLRRRCSVTEGLHDPIQPFNPESEWLLFAIDTFTGLGEHTCSAL
jgi:hypothetical protein